MMKLTKFAALFCALSMMTLAAGCGASDSEDSTAESATETSVTEEETEEATEEATEATEEEDADDDSTDADATEDEDDTSAEVDNGVIDTDASYGSLNFRISANWIVSETSSQISYQLPDSTGAIIIQTTDGVDTEYTTEDEMIEAIAEQSEAAWDSMDGLEVIESDWDTTIIDGKKCYVISYTYDVSSVSTTNTSVFFANYTDDEKVVYAITGTALTSDSEIMDDLSELLSTITFSTSDAE